MRLYTRLNLATLMLLAAAVGGCSRDEPQVPAATSQTQSSRQPYLPTTVTGCLRAGASGNTFVLTTAATTGGGKAATYELTNTANVNLEEHVGKRVEVSGVVESQSQIATRQSPQTADNATGTAGKPGTPTVQTGTELSVQRLDVKTVKAAGGDCGM